MTDGELKRRFDADGYVVIPGFLASGALTDLQSQITRYVCEVVPRLPEADAFYEDRARPETLKQLNRLQQDPHFAALTHDAQWTGTAAVLLGEPVVCLGAEWFNKPPATEHATPPHQDNFYFCFTPPLVLTMWLALDDVDAENGGLRYVPGSHRSGIRPHGRTKTLGFSQGITDYGAADRSAEVLVSARPGDVLIHHGDTIHRADANRSRSRHRHSFALVFRGVSCVRDDAAFQRYQQSATAQHQELGVATP